MIIYKFMLIYQPKTKTIKPHGLSITVKILSYVFKRYLLHQDNTESSHYNHIMLFQPTFITALAQKTHKDPKLCVVR